MYCMPDVTARSMTSMSNHWVIDEYLTGHKNFLSYTIFINGCLAILKKIKISATKERIECRERLCYNVK